MTTSQERMSSLEEQIKNLAFKEDKKLKNITQMLKDCLMFISAAKQEHGISSSQKARKIDTLIIRSIKTSIAFMKLGYMNTKSNYDYQKSMLSMLIRAYA